MRILSIHFGHDSSICTLNNGVIEEYFLVERFTRKKHDDDVYQILKYIFSIIDKKIDAICLSTFGENSNSLLNSFEKYKKYNPNAKIYVESDHHLNHASLSFFNSKFSESIVVVVDGSGSTIDNNLVEVESIFKYDKFKYELIYKNVVEIFSSMSLPWDKKFNKHYTKYNHKNIFGIGGLYDIASVLTGNTPDDCGKAMGLSSYGSSNKLFENLFLEKNIFNNNFFKDSSQKIKHFLKNPIKKIKLSNYKLHADFCYEVQQQTQQAVGDLIEEAIKTTGITQVCISGGYGMNIVANYYYIQRFPDVEFYFEPMCNDNGVSIGSAMNLYFRLTNAPPNSIQTTSFHGIKHNVSNYKGKTTSIKDIAILLKQDKSVAVYTGLAEAGQRALGNRSILFNALNPDAKNLVNKIKRREWYRPFACMVLEEDANIYFDMGRIKSSPFMTICFPVKKQYQKIIPGVTHVDGTCRIQTVNNGYIYELLKEFKKLSGHGILLNTSFNLSGEPLVETPEDAFNTFNNTCLDYLWFEETNQLFKKKNNTQVTEIV